MQTQTDHSEPADDGASLQRSERLGDRTQSVTTKTTENPSGAPQWSYPAP